QFSASPLHAPQATWLRGETGYREALERQKSTGQPVLVLFTAPWCGPCKRFQAERVRTPAFAEQTAGYIRVHVDNSADVPDNRLLQDFGGTHYPSLFVQNADGTHRQIGLFGPEGFLPAEALGL
ncbi:MAG: thioredoxin family protein, partial [Candidatus Melainabacteria bacterium]